MSIKVISLYLCQLPGGPRLVGAWGTTRSECIDNLEARFPGIKQRLYGEKGDLLSYIEV